jgi:hypothetical protein
VGTYRQFNTIEEVTAEVRSYYDITRAGAKGPWPQVKIEPLSCEKPRGN